MRIFILILFLLPATCFGQTKDYKAYDRAVKYNNEGNIEKAIKYANKALEKSSDWIKPNLLLASIYANNNQIDLAADYLLKVYDENTLNDVKGIQQVARLFYNNGFYEKALYYFEKIISNNIEESKFSSKIDRYLQNSRFAIKAIKTPIDFDAKNLGELVNSHMTEYVNAITVDAKKILFTRRIESNKNRDQEDLFVYDIQSNTLSPLPFNTLQNEGAITVSADGSMYVYTACDRVNSIGGCDLYIRQYSKENGWSKEYNLGANINTNKWESQACFSPDEKYLYFISNRPGGFGKEDVWRSEITKKGFMPAENLGSSINTNQVEMSPFLHPDNLTLYFASDGHIGMGDDDLFVNQVATKNNTAICYAQDSFTYSKPKLSFKKWVKQQKQHISTTKYYKLNHRILLGSFFVFQVCFWVLSLLVFIFLDWKIPLALIIFRLLIQFIVLYKAMKKLDEKDLIYWFPFLEIILIIFQFTTFISNSSSKTALWK